MLKWLFLYASMLATATCRFAGDGCIANGQLGICSVLSLCPLLKLEVEAAGNPMPHHMVIKLQQLKCGFNSYEPLICCVKTTTMDGGITYGEFMKDDWGDYPTWATTTHRPDVDAVRITNTRNGDKPPDVSGHRNLNKLSSDCGSMDANRISFGNRTSLYEMPWMVMLSYKKRAESEINCGGTLINEWYVLTAAHCVSFLGDNTKLEYVVLGDWDITSDPDCELTGGTSLTGLQQSCAPPKRNVAIDSIIAHPGYRPQTLYDDIALIRLAERADFTLDTMAPICLPVSEELQSENLVNETGIVAGWGITELGYKSPVLLSVGLRIISNDDCQAAFRKSPRIYDTQICAGGEDGKDTCGADSGGPLMFQGRIGTGGIKFVQRGVVSYGSKRCGVKGVPGVFTRVAYYMDWILDNIS